MSAERAALAGEQGEQDCVVTASGLDTAEFLLSAGPSEPLRSLAATASGGESARVMLALKAAPAAIPLVANDAAGAAEQGGPGQGAMRLCAPGMLLASHYKQPCVKGSSWRPAEQPVAGLSLTCQPVHG